MTEGTNTLTRKNVADTIDAGSNNVAGAEIRAFIERVERLEEEKQTIADDVKDVWSEAKSRGYDVKVLKRIVKERKQDPNERSEADAIYDLYAQAIGHQGSLDLGRAA